VHQLIRFAESVESAIPASEWSSVVIVPSNLRLALALVAYAFLALLVWRTMDPDKVRLVVFAILGLFAFRTITHAVREKRLASEEHGQPGLENDGNK
jgi:hypothetical protein